MEFIVREGLDTQSNFLTWLALTYKDFDVESKKGGKDSSAKVSYYSVPAAFDIETSSFVNEDGEERAVTYLWNFGIFNHVTSGRDWDSYKIFIRQVQDILSTYQNLRLVVYVHNLPYEWQFMRKHFIWDDVFLMDDRKPAYALQGGIEYRCSFKLSMCSLAKIGDDLTRYKVAKMVGDLDYSKVRFPATPLTDMEKKYGEHDVRVLLSFIQCKIEDDGGILKIPSYKNWICPSGVQRGVL